MPFVQLAYLPERAATIASMAERSSAGWPAGDSLVAKGIALREGAEHESNRRIVGTDVRLLVRGSGLCCDAAGGLGAGCFAS